MKPREGIKMFDLSTTIMDYDPKGEFAVGDRVEYDRPRNLGVRIGTIHSFYSDGWAFVLIENDPSVSATTVDPKRLRLEKSKT